MNRGPSLILGRAKFGKADQWGKRYTDVLADVGDSKMGVFDLGHKELVGAEALIIRFC